MISGRLFALAYLGLTLSAGTLLASAHAAEAPVPGDLQSMKSELLNLNRDISQLENELLFPSTETAIVVSLEPGSGVRIVDVNLQIDDKPAGSHYYSDAELVALTKGGMQRLYTGNVSSGPHTLKVAMNGRDKDGKDFQRTASYTFTKGPQRKVIELKAVSVSNVNQGQGDIRFKEWEIQ